jgi:SAM-dependent methyltransferase
MNPATTTEDNRAVPGEYVDEIIRQRATWERKPILREIYARYFRLAARYMAPGSHTLEIGGGSGRLKENLGLPIISSDVFLTPWIDLQLDAHVIPIQNESLQNVVAIDVLHHLPDPLKFFRECIRILVPKGRILLLEPHISLWSLFIYRYFHHEPCVLSDTVWGPRPTAIDHNFANEALPWLILQRHRHQFDKEFPELRFLHSEHLDFLAYASTGGFNRDFPVPGIATKTLLGLETLIPNIVMKYVTGMRMFVVLEKR